MVVKELRDYLERAPRGTAKRLAEVTGMDHAGFSNRLHEKRGMRFTYEQIGAIAEVIGAPPGWPLLKWEVGEVLQTVLRLASAQTGAPAHRNAVQKHDGIVGLGRVVDDPAFELPANEKGETLSRLPPTGDD